MAVMLPFVRRPASLLRCAPSCPCSNEPSRKSSTAAPPTGAVLQRLALEQPDAMLVIDTLAREFLFGRASGD